MPIVAHDDALERIISTSQPINELAGGFGGEQGPAEGPVWWQEGRLSAVQRHPQQPPDEVDRGRGRVGIQ